jgi:hypothetical protein
LQVTEYGVFDDEFIDSGVLDLRQQEAGVKLKGLLKQASPPVAAWSTPARRWFDLNGFQQQTMSLFGQTFGLHEETMKDAGLFQHQKIEVLTPGPAANWVVDNWAAEAPPAGGALDCNSEDADFDSELEPPAGGAGLHRRASSAPEQGAAAAPPAQRQHGLVVVHELHVHPPLRDCVWDSAGRLLEAPDPSLAKAQYAIFVFGDEAMLTVRKDYVDREEESEMASNNIKHSMGWGRGFNSGEESAAAVAAATAPADVMSALRQRIERGDADLRINSSSAKYLAFSAIEVIMENNYCIHDDLRRWLATLEQEIRDQPTTAHTYHLYELGKLATGYGAELRALLQCLEGTVEKDRNGPLAVFFQNEYIFFKDLSDEIKTVSAEVGLGS